MKNVLILLGLLSASLSYSQTPFTDYFGEASEVNLIRDFTLTDNGDYLIHAYGNYDEQFDADIASFRVSETEGLIDSLFTEAPGSHLLFSAEEAPGGTSIVCVRSQLNDVIFTNMSIRYLDANGEETERIEFGEPGYESPTQTTIDDQQNYFVSYIQRTAPFQRNSDNRLRMVNADRETVYDIDLDIPGGFIYDLIPLGGGEVVALSFGSGPDGNQIQVLRITAAGIITWRTIPEDEDDLFILGAGFYDGSELFLIDNSSDAILNVDPATGAIMNRYDYEGANATTLLSPIVYYEGDAWILGRQDIYRLRLIDGAYQEIANYPIESTALRGHKLRSGNVWEFIDAAGRLQRFDFEQELYTVIVDMDRPIVSSASESTVNVHVKEDGFVTGVERDAGAIYVPIANQYQNDGVLTGSLELPDQDQFNYFSDPEVLGLPDGGLAVLGVIRDETFQQEARLDIYDQDGTLTSQGSLVEFGDNLIFYYGLTWLADGTIGAHIRNSALEGSENLFFRIDPNAPVYTPVQTLDFFNTNSPEAIFALEEQAIGLLQVSTANGLTINMHKVSLNDGLQWERAIPVDGTEDPIDYFRGRSNKLSALPNDDILFSYIYQNGDEDTELRLRILDGDTGGDLQEFSSDKAYTSASSAVIDADRIAVVGCTYNLDHEDGDDRYLLHYQQYDPSGILLSEASTELAEQFIITGLETLDNGFLVAYGSVIEQTDINALLVVMNEQGEITEVLSPTKMPWGELTVGPNPSTDLLRIQFSNEYQGDLAVNLYTTSGRVVRQWSAEKQGADFTWEASLTELPAGTYWVQVKSPEGQVTKGWVKN